jgi:hypothetical protein
MRDVYYYIAFIVDTPVYEKDEIVLDAGVDLLDGPFETRELAMLVFQRVPDRFPLQSYAAAFGVLGDGNTAGIRLAVVKVERERWARYVRAHLEECRKSRTNFWPIHPTLSMQERALTKACKTLRRQQKAVEKARIASLKKRQRERERKEAKAPLAQAVA